MTPSSLVLDDVSVILGGRRIIDRVSLVVAAGERVAVVGPSGAGKSVLARVAGALAKPSSGEIGLFGQAAKPPLRAEQRAALAMVMQGGSLFDELSVEANLRLGARAGSAVSWASMSARVDRLMVDFGLDRLIGRRVQGLATGERRRLEVVRALLGEPDLLILDEPFEGAAADAGSLSEALHRAARRRGMALLLFTQDAELAHRLDADLRNLSGGRLA